MADRIEIAKKFIEEQRQKRDDIIGAFVVGSVARGEDKESSDIDLNLIVEGAIQRSVINTWRDGVLIDSALQSKEAYTDLEKVLQNPFQATHVNDALILYDPTGFFTRLQQEVRAVFMEPQWLSKRLQFFLNGAQKGVEGLKKAIAAGDSFEICGNAGWILGGVVAIPLLRMGITPSSTRPLVQLRDVSKELHEHICELEGSNEKSVDDVLALLAPFAEVGSLTENSLWRNSSEYFVKKVEWMAKNGLNREAFHTMCFWSFWPFSAFGESEKSQLKPEEYRLVQSWLKKMGWEGEEVLDAKLQLIESIMKEMEELVADLPSSASSTATKGYDIYHENNRELQDAFDSRRLADRVNELIVHDEITDMDRDFIETRDMFFISTVDDIGRPTVSYKGGDSGFVQVVNKKTIAFPGYDGNGMFLTAGNIASNNHVGLLFIDFENPRRLRLHGTATVSLDDPLLSEYIEAQYIIRITIRNLFINCPRYIHRYKKVEQSEYVPKQGCPIPIPEWKTSEAVRDVLPK